MAEVNPVFSNAGTEIAPAPQSVTESSVSKGTAEFNNARIRPVIDDYYQTNSISRASLTMAECSRVYGPMRAVAAE